MFWWLMNVTHWLVFSGSRCCHCDDTHYSETHSWSWREDSFCEAENTTEKEKNYLNILQSQWSTYGHSIRSVLYMNSSTLTTCLFWTCRQWTTSYRVHTAAPPLRVDGRRSPRLQSRFASRPPLDHLPLPPDAKVTKSRHLRKQLLTRQQFCFGNMAVLSTITENLNLQKSTHLHPPWTILQI